MVDKRAADSRPSEQPINKRVTRSSSTPRTGEKISNAKKKTQQSAGSTPKDEKITELGKRTGAIPKSTSKDPEIEETSNKVDAKNTEKTNATKQKEIENMTPLQQLFELTNSTSATLTTLQSQPTVPISNNLNTASTQNATSINGMSNMSTLGVYRSDIARPKTNQNEMYQLVPPTNAQQGGMPQSPTSKITEGMSSMEIIELDDEMTGHDPKKLEEVYLKFLGQCDKYLIGMRRFRTLVRDPTLVYQATKTQIELLEKYLERIYNKATIMENSDVLPPSYQCRMQDYLLDVDDLYMMVKTEILVRQAELEPMATRADHRHRTNPLDNLQLKRVTVERFGGEYKKWPNFKSKFCQFFHDNVEIDDLTRFFRLDEHIEKDSEAYNLISGFERVAENYKHAWYQLCTTYDNKRKLVEETINSFLDVAPMQSATRGNLMIIINTINHLTKSLLRYEETKVQHWDPIIMSIALRKLDGETLGLWKRERPQRDIPKLAPFMQFLDNRAESMEGGVTTTQSTQNQQSQNQPQPPSGAGQTPASGGGNQLRSQIRRPVKCMMCGGEHQLFSCSTFKKLPLDQRRRRVEQLRVCENCLKPKCSPDRCKLGPCRTCNVKHNGLICTSASAPTVAAATGAQS